MRRSDRLTIDRGADVASPHDAIRPGQVSEGVARSSLHRHVPGRRGFGRWGIALALGAYVAVAVLLVVFIPSFVLFYFTSGAIYAIAALGQDWLVCRAGDASVGAAAFLLIGAFTTAAVEHLSWGGFPITLVASFIVGGVIGLGIGLIGLRFVGLYLILTTLALQYLAVYGAKQYQAHLNGGAGLIVSARWLGGSVFGTGRTFAILSFALLGIAIIVLRNLYSGSCGTVWGAIASNRLGAAASGIDVRRWRLKAFFGSCAITSAAGSLLAVQLQYVTDTPFSLALAVAVLTMVFIGGRGTLSGPIVGAMLVTFIPFGIQQLGSLVPAGSSVGTWMASNYGFVADALFGFALLGVLISRGNGIAQLVTSLWSKFFSRKQAVGSHG